MMDGLIIMLGVFINLLYTHTMPNNHYSTTYMLCGTPTLNPRLKDIPVRIPQPQPDVPISIYEIQKGLKKRAFDVIK